MVNVYIVYDLDAWTKDPTNNFKFENCIFWATNTEKIGIKKSMYQVYIIKYIWTFYESLLKKMYCKTIFFFGE